MKRLPASQRYKRHKDRWKRYEKQLPGQRVQIDVKFIAPSGGRRSTTSSRPSTTAPGCGSCGSIPAESEDRDPVPRLRPRELPFEVETIQTDNGAEFQCSFHWHLLDRGIGHVYIKPATPRLNGKVERSHRIDDEEFYRLSRAS